MGQIAILAGKTAPYDFDLFSRTLDPAKNAVRRFLSTEALLSFEGVQNQDILLAHRQPVGADLLSRCPNLRGIVSLSIGLDSIDVETATRMGIAVTVPRTEQNIAALAEGIVSMTLASTTDLFRKQRLLHENRPRDRSLGRLLLSKTVGFIGFGQIGQAAAKRLLPFGVNIIANTRTARRLPDGVSAASLDDVLTKSDIVIVAASLNEESLGLLNAEKLNRMKPNVVFVNIARGSIVDEDALIHFASERPEMRLALDVYQTEPLPAESLLRSLPNAVLTPHCIGYSSEMWQFRLDAIFKNAKAILQGQWPDNVVNEEIEAQWRKRWQDQVV